MTKNTVTALAASLFAIGLYSSPASALNPRSFISANGSDSNACTRTAPCRTLQIAHNNTNAGGEINMLDPAGYGPVVITKSISIVNDGVGSAGILVPTAATGITINAGASDVVNLRGLIIEGSGVGLSGILFNTGKSLTIENCVVRNHTAAGIDFRPSATGSLQVANTTIASNSDGILIRPSGATTQATVGLSRIGVYNNGNFGVFVDGTASFASTMINVIVNDSVALNNGGVGFGVAEETAGSIPVTSLMVVGSVSSFNGTGLRADGPRSILRVGQSKVTGNGVGWSTVNFGVLQSYGDNKIDGNAAGEAPPPSVANK